MQAILPAPLQQQQQHERMDATDSDLRAALHAAATGILAPSHYKETGSHSSPNSGSPHEHIIDPAIGGPGDIGMMSTGNGSGDEDADGRRGKTRELSQSKRAAQNRAAQRAFRQRKEGYIKKLEEQVREHHVLEENYKAIQAENYSLREYIIHLQSRLIDNQQEYPDPPPHVNLSHPQASQVLNAQALSNNQARTEQHGGIHEGGMGGGVGGQAPVAPMTQLQQAASRSLATAGLKHPHPAEETYGQQHHIKRLRDDETSNTEELIRTQLGGAHGLPNMTN
ncbi:hypothetical protein BJ878DRAFT_78290 [Calycina marina]|uniref:Putative transcription factor kapC n=1 Tax=Calycina marina TaxID=1763456 RepID=A0A9P7Z2V2_9HELO|nr:hypothetical protein BJ878DRAFT_78290 [Calycina marina]